MQIKYDPNQIEQKWQKLWFENNIYKAEPETSQKDKKYILVEFPYPSGASLHVGHAFRYTIPDVYSRYLRMKGYNVLFPFGYDAFGLPTEERARKDGKNPVETTRENIEAFRGQIQRLGYGFDWSRELATTDPKYYKWTQWIFGEMWKAGLVEQREVELWWCADLGTVLANEEVLDDPNNPGQKISERGEYPVERKKMKQWVIKITEYAEKLLEGLNQVDWPEYIKDMQRNWIGKSEGVEVDWNINSIDRKITTFTTRVETLPSVTFIALSPDYPQLLDIIPKEYKDSVKEYIESVKNKSERERNIGKVKSGVFSGLYVDPSPLQDQNDSGYYDLIPVCIADYVISSYGTGAIMGVPGHDDRDREFADFINNSLSEGKINIKQNISEVGTLYNSGKFNGESIETARQNIIQLLTEQRIGSKKINYKFRDWVFSRQRYWGEPFPFEYLRLEAIRKTSNITQRKNVHPFNLAVNYDYVDREYNDGIVSANTKVLQVTLLEADKLPLELPAVKDYEPSRDGQSPLAKTDWINIRDENGKIIGKHESDTMPNWAGSSWYFLRFIDPHNDGEFASSDKLNYWLPIDHYFGGSEHTTLHLLYSRFWHQFLYDQDLVPTQEPYQMRTNGGMLLGPDGRKMSKSLGNVISPSDKINEVGADALRLYINFIGPYDATVVWQDSGLKACKRFLDEVWNLQNKVSENNQDDNKVWVALNKMIKSIEENLELQKGNVAVAEMMSFKNLLKEQTNISIKLWKRFIKVLAPFAPHIADELWYSINKFDPSNFANSVHLTNWETYDPAMVVDESVTMVVQVNGKVRGSFETKKGADEHELIEQAKNVVAKWIDDQEIKFAKVIPNKLVTLVV